MFDVLLDECGLAELLCVYMKNNLAHPCRHTMQSQMNVRRGTQQHPISSNANR